MYFWSIKYCSNNGKIKSTYNGKAARGGVYTGPSSVRKATREVVSRSLAIISIFYRQSFNIKCSCLFEVHFIQGTSLCKGDSGGGYAFPFKLNGRTRYYLRGVVSTSPPLPLGLSCNIYTYTSFTDIMQHKRIIMTHMHWLLKLFWREKKLFIVLKKCCKFVPMGDVSLKKGILINRLCFDDR